MTTESQKPSRTTDSDNAGWLRRLVRRLISVVKHTDKPDQIYWTVLLFPATPKAIGICLKYATDGKWTRKGERVPLLESHERVWQLHVGAWILWLWKKRIKLNIAQPSNNRI